VPEPPFRGGWGNTIEKQYVMDIWGKDGEGKSPVYETVSIYRFQYET